jgi:hypothetical protein
MADLVRQFTLERMHSGNPAFYLLKEEFQSYLASPQSLGKCEKIAHCLDQLEQHDEAGSWYENAGRLILAENFTPPEQKAMAALREFERALKCYGTGGDEDAFAECAEMIKTLRRACASA